MGKTMNRAFVISFLFLLVTLQIVFALDRVLYEQAKTQCFDRFDKEKCLSYFDELLASKTGQEDHIEESIEESFQRKEARYSDLQRKDTMSRFFREEFDYATRRVDALKQKALRGIEVQARNRLQANKEAAEVSLEAYKLTEKTQCLGLDEEECLQVHATLLETKRKYLTQVIEGVSNGLTAMFAYAQRSSFIAEPLVVQLGSEINQELAKTRLLRARIRTEDILGKDIPEFTALLKNSRTLNAQISLLHAYGQLYALSRILSVMHIRWERKVMHIFVSENADELESYLSQFSSALDNAALELHEAADLLSRFNGQQGKKITNHLSLAYVSLYSAAAEQTKMYIWIQKKGIAFTHAYDLIEEATDNRIHGIMQSQEEFIDEPQINAKLYPEKGETIVTLSYEPFEQYIFSTVNQEQLIRLIARKLHKEEEKVKQQLRFELGGKE